MITYNRVTRRRKKLEPLRGRLRDYTIAYVDRYHKPTDTDKNLCEKSLKKGLTEQLGTINYGTSEYITIGIEPYDYDDYMTETEDIDYELMQMDYDTDRENVEYILDKYNFNFFDISIKYGYYEGFYLSIKTNFDFYNWQDKANALKEATQIKNMLIECCDVGLCEVWPGWITSYKDYKESIKNIKAAIWQAKQDIKSTKTWLQEQRNAG